MNRFPIHQRFSIARHQLQNPSINVSIQSETFRLMTPQNYNIEYRVNVFPNGRSPAEIGRFLVFLQFKFPRNIRITADYTFIVGSTQTRSFQHCYKTSSSFGGILCPNRLIFYPTPMLINDRLSIELHGTVIIQNFSLYSISPRTTPTTTPTTSNSPRSSAPFIRRLPSVPSKIVRKEKSLVVVETPKSETEKNIAMILQKHLEEERRTAATPTNETPTRTKSSKKKVVEEDVVEATVKDIAPAASKESSTNARAASSNKKDVVEVPVEATDSKNIADAEEDVVEVPVMNDLKNINDETLTPAAATDILKEAFGEIEVETNENQEMNVSDIPSNDDVHEPPPQSPEPPQNSQTSGSDIQQTSDSPSSATTEEKPPSSATEAQQLSPPVSTTTDEPGKRVRTRTSRYVHFFDEDEDDKKEAAAKKNRKRKSNEATSNSAKSKKDTEYFPPSKRSRSSARISVTTAAEVKSDNSKIIYDCKIEGVVKFFDVNKKMLSEKSNGFATLFEANTEQSTFELEGIPDETLEAVFNFCHGLPLKDDMNNKEYSSILFFANAFEMPELKILCEERLAEISSGTPEKKKKLEKLPKSCKNLLIENVRNKNVSPEVLML